MHQTRSGRHTGCRSYIQQAITSYMLTKNAAHNRKGSILADLLAAIETDFGMETTTVGCVTWDC